jgi:hypothetical protein
MHAPGSLIKPLDGIAFFHPVGLSTQILFFSALYMFFVSLKMIPKRGFTVTSSSTASIISARFG